MLVFIIIFNLFLTLLNLYIAIRLWQLRYFLIKVNRTLMMLERRIYKIFHPAPKVIFKGYTGAHTLHQSYLKLLFQLELITKIVSLASWCSKIWYRQGRFKKSSKYLNSKA